MKRLISVLLSMILQGVCSVSMGQVLNNVEATGDVVIANITPQQARLEALMAAKANAMIEAGVGEEVNSTQALLTSNEDVMFSQISSIELRGKIASYKILEDRINVTSDGVPHYFIRIRAKIEKYSSVSDPQFDVTLTGISASGYREGKKLTFSVETTKDCYLNVFMLESFETGTLLYPVNNGEKRKMVKGGQAISFPTKKTIQYTLYLADTKTKSEKNHLVVVATKGNYDFSGDVNYESLTQWLYSIEPSQRAVMSAPVLIVK